MKTKMLGLLLMTVIASPAASAMTWYVSGDIGIYSVAGSFDIAPGTCSDISNVDVTLTADGSTISSNFWGGSCVWPDPSNPQPGLPFFQFTGGYQLLPGVNGILPDSGGSFSYGYSLYDPNAIGQDEYSVLNFDTAPPAAVPEPGTLALLGLGLAGLGLSRRRKAA